MTLVLPNLICCLIGLQWPGVDPIIGGGLVKADKLISVHPVAPWLGPSVRWKVTHRSIVAKSVFASGSLFFEAEFS